MANVKEFAKKLAEDQALAKTLAQASSTEEFLTTAKEAGFELTEADIAELEEALKTELPDDVLDNVAGGAMPFPLTRFDQYKKSSSGNGGKIS